MTTGKSNARWIRAKVDNSSSSLTALNSVKRVQTFGLKYGTQDVTAYNHGVLNVTLGHPEAPIQMMGAFDTADHDLLTAIVGKETDSGSAWTCTVQIEVGVLAAPTTGDRKFSGEYKCVSYEVNGNDLTWSALFLPGSSTAPAWGTL